MKRFIIAASVLSASFFSSSASAIFWQDNYARQGQAKDQYEHVVWGKGGVWYNLQQNCTGQIQFAGWKGPVAYNLYKVKQKPYNFYVWRKPGGAFGDQLYFGQDDGYEYLLHQQGNIFGTGVPAARLLTKTVHCW